MYCSIFLLHKSHWHERDDVSNHQPLDCLFHSSLTLTTKKPIEVPYYWPLMMRIQWWSMVSPHKGPIMRKEFPCHNVLCHNTIHSGSCEVWQLAIIVQTTILLLCHPYTVETLYNTVNFCCSTHKRHSIARPKGRGMGCLLWVQRATYSVDLSKLSSIKYLL